MHLYVDGKEQERDVLLDELNQPFNAKAPVRVGGGGGPEANFRGRLREVRIDSVDLTRAHIAILSTAESLAEIIAIPEPKRSYGQRWKLRNYFLAHHGGRRDVDEGQQWRRWQQSARQSAAQRTRHKLDHAGRSQ